MAFKKSEVPDHEKTDEIIDHLVEAFDIFVSEYNMAIKGNKSAAVRARAMSVAISKGLKQFRTESMELWK